MDNARRLEANRRRRIKAQGGDPDATTASQKPLPNRNLSQDQFSPMYHGTPRNLSPGDSIDPGHSGEMSGMSRPGYVYFSHDAKNADRYRKGGNRRRATPGNEGHLYEVRPTGTYGDDPGSVDSYRSRDSLKVTREVTPTMPSAPVKVTHDPSRYIGQDSEYRSDSDFFERKWYGD